MKKLAVGSLQLASEDKRVGSGQLANEDKRVGSGEDRGLLCRDDRGGCWRSGRFSQVDCGLWLGCGVREFF